MADNEDNKLLPQGEAGNSNLQQGNVNEFNTISSKHKANIAVFYWDITKDSVTATFFYYQILIAQTMYQIKHQPEILNWHWEDAQLIGSTLSKIQKMLMSQYGPG